MRRPEKFAYVLVAAILAAPFTANAFSDPTRPMDFAGTPTRAARAAPSGPVLQSTLVSPQRRLAVISGRQVRVGDSIDGAVITDISPYEVRMTKGGRETTLRLLPKINKDVETVK